MSGARRQMESLKFDYRGCDIVLPPPQYTQTPIINRMSITERQVFISSRKNALAYIDGNSSIKNNYEKQMIPSDGRYEKDNDPGIVLSSDSDNDLRFPIHERKQRKMLASDVEKPVYNNSYNNEAQRQMYHNQGKPCNFILSPQRQGSNYQIDNISDMRERPVNMSFGNNSCTSSILENRLGLKSMECPRANIEKYAKPRSEQQLSGSVQNSFVGQLNQTEQHKFVEPSTSVGYRNYPVNYLGQKPSTVNMGRTNQLSFHESEQSDHINLGASSTRRSRCDQMYANEPNRSIPALVSRSVPNSAHGSLEQSQNFRGRSIPSHSTDICHDNSERTFMKNRYEGFSGVVLKRPREGEDRCSENPYSNNEVYRNQIRKDNSHQTIISDNREMQSPEIWPEITSMEHSGGLVYPRIREKKDHSNNSQDHYSNKESHEQSRAKRYCNDVTRREFEVREQSRAPNSDSCKRENDLRENIDFIRKRDGCKEENRMLDEFRIGPELRDSRPRQQCYRFNSWENSIHDQRESDIQREHYSSPRDFVERDRPSHVSKDKNQSPRFERSLRKFVENVNDRYSREMGKHNFDEYWSKEYPNEQESDRSMSSKRYEKSVFRSRSPERSVFRSSSPDTSVFRSRSPETSVFRSRSPDRSVFRSRNPERSEFKSGSPERSMFRSESPQRSMFRSRSPQRSMFRSRSPQRSMFRSESLQRSMFRSRSPQRSMFRSRSPQRSMFRSRSPQRSMSSLKSPERGRSFNPDPYNQECNQIDKEEMYESQHYSKEKSPRNSVCTSKGISRQPKANRIPEQDAQLNCSDRNLGNPKPPAQPGKKQKVKVHWKDLSDEAIMKLRKRAEKPENPVVINFGNFVRTQFNEDGLPIINLTEDERRVKVIFLDCSQPQLTLTQFRAEKLKNFLHKMVRLAPIEPGVHPKFFNVQYIDHSLVLECNNMATYKWLRQQLQTSVSRPWKKAQLKVIPKFKFVTGKLIIPCDVLATINSVFEIIKRCNPGLYPERWRIFYKTTSDGSFGCYFILGIEQESYDKIIANKCKILYGKEVLTIKFPHLQPAKANPAQKPNSSKISKEQKPKFKGKDN